MRLFFKISSFSILMGCLAMSYAEQMPSVPANMYLCSVRNANTGKIFYGKSIKESYAEMYARSTCQMKSHSGNCIVKAHCEYGSREVES